MDQPNRFCTSEDRGQPTSLYPQRLLSERFAPPLPCHPARPGLPWGAKSRDLRLFKPLANSSWRHRPTLVIPSGADLSRRAVEGSAVLSTSDGTRTLPTTRAMVHHFKVHAPRFPPALLARQPHRTQLDDGPDGNPEACVSSPGSAAAAGQHRLRRLHRRPGATESAGDAMVIGTRRQTRVHQGSGRLGGPCVQKNYATSWRGLPAIPSSSVCAT